MTSAPILRSSALREAQTLANAPAPVRHSPGPAAFAASLSAAESSAAGRPRPVPTSGSSTPVAQSVPFQDAIGAAARKYGVRPALLAAVVKQESNFNPTAR